MDLQAARTVMIDTQVRTSDVTDRRLVAAMASTARETFVPADKAAIAYAEIDIDIGQGRTLMTCRDLAKLIGVTELQGTERVLDVAPGSGYSTAILAKLAHEVVALEEDETLAEQLKANLAKEGLSGPDVVVGPLKAGAPAKGPFDAIIVNGAVEIVPQAWLDQLGEGGRLAVPYSEGVVRRVRIYTRAGEKTSWRTPFECGAPDLPGFQRAPEFRL